MDKYTKAECDYGPGTWDEVCGTCYHFNYIKHGKNPQGRGGKEAYGSCRIVKGRVYGMDGCKFHVYDSKSAMEEHHILEEPPPGGWKLKEFGDISKWGITVRETGTD